MGGKGNDIRYVATSYIKETPSQALSFTACDRRVEKNPGDEEARKQLDEIQRMEAVQENMMNAMEHHPEAFGQACSVLDMQVPALAVARC